MTEWQVRRLLQSLDGVLRPYCKRGQNNQILIEDGGLAILHRAKELRDSGVLLQDLVKVIEKELTKPASSLDKDSEQNSANLEQELIAELRNRIAALEQDKIYLQRKLDQLMAQLQAKDEQLRAMLPGPRPKRWWHFWR